MSVGYRLLATSELNDSLLQSWRDIQQGSVVYASPYFCPEFTQAVGQVRDDVRVVLIETDGTPTGFFPHQRSAWGMGKPVGGPFSDYHGVIAAPGSGWRLDEVMRAARLSVWAFDHLAGETTQFQPHAQAGATSPQIDLSEGFEQFERGRREAGSDFIRKTQGLARKLAREVGELRFVFHHPEALPQLIEWKSAQYRRSNPAGKDLVFSNPWTTSLLRRILGIQTPGFAGVCSALYAGDKLVAAHMGMRSQHHLHYWFPSYDMDVSKYSPGSILLLRMAEAAPSQGIRLIDLGKGDSQYKRTLMTGAAPLLEGAVEQPSVLSLARRARRAAEASDAQGGMAAVLLNVPIRAIRRMERLGRFR